MSISTSLSKDLVILQFLHLLSSVSNNLHIFRDRQTKSGQNIQLGFMKMAEGAMIALRNPVAHENLNISQDDAMRQLMFASMIMYKIDEGVIHSGITEQE
ncbi:TIGR02391 family protein [Lachnospiraceae bacterium 62-26]